MGQSEPTSTQIRTLAELVGERDDLRRRIQRSLFRYYKDEVREDVPASAAPPLRRSADLWPMLSEPEIWVDDRGEAGTNFVLAFSCSWDREHGLCVRVQDWRVVDIGGADA
jgi:hypothetical protein